MRFLGGTVSLPLLLGPGGFFVCHCLLRDTVEMSALLFIHTSDVW